MEPLPWIVSAYGAPRAAALQAAAEAIALSTSGQDALALASTLEPGWGRVRSSFEILRSRPERSLPAVPALAAWLIVAPQRQGGLRQLLVGGEERALIDGWETAAVLHEAVHSVNDTLTPGPMSASAALLIGLFDTSLVPLALEQLGRPTSQVHRGLIAFLGTARTRLDDVASALTAFSRRTVRIGKMNPASRHPRTCPAPPSTPPPGPSGHA
jgi:hypothetical protein